MPVARRERRKKKSDSHYSKHSHTLDASATEKKRHFDRLDLVGAVAAAAADMLTVNERGKTFMLFMSNSTIYVRNLIYMFIYLFLDCCYRSPFCVRVHA